MNYLLDTCLISELVTKRPTQAVIDWLDSQPPETLFLSVITIGEIAKGIEKLELSQRKDHLTVWLNETLLTRFSGQIVGIDTPTMLLWGKLVGQLEKSGKPIPLIDSLIAAIALQHSLCLVTRNEDDFARTGVMILNPWKI